MTGEPVLTRAITHQELIARLQKWARVKNSRDAYIRAGLQAGLTINAIATHMQVSHGVIEKIRKQERGPA
jgi:hypothetical protein